MCPIEEAKEIALSMGSPLPKEPPLISPYDPYLGYHKDWVIEMRGDCDLEEYEFSFTKGLQKALEHRFLFELNWAGLLFKNSNSYRLILSHGNNYVMSLDINPNLDLPYVVTSTTSNYFHQKTPNWIDPYLLLLDPPKDILEHAFDFLTKAWELSFDRYNLFLKGEDTTIKECFFFWSKENDRSFVQYEFGIKGLNYFVFKLHTLNSSLDFIDYYRRHLGVTYV